MVCFRLDVASSEVGSAKTVSGFTGRSLCIVCVLCGGQSPAADARPVVPQETERRLKDILAGKKATSGAVVAAPALVPKKKSALARAQQGSQPPIFHVRLLRADPLRPPSAYNL